MLKYIHVLIGVTMLGFIIAGYFYFNVNRKNPAALQKGLRLSLMMDGFILFALIFLFITGSFLVTANHLSLAVPWVEMAYRLLGLVMMCWIVLVIIKWINLRRGGDVFLGQKIFHTCHVLIIILMIMIIHDAVMKTTLFHR